MPQMNLAEALIDGLIWSLRKDPKATIIGRLTERTGDPVIFTGKLAL